MANINSVITYNANLSAAQAQVKALTGNIAGLTVAFNALDKAALKAQRSAAGAFATNVGGRMIGTSAAFLTTNLIAPMLTIGSNNFEKVAYAAGITGVLVFAIGFVTSFFLLEPKAEGSPE